MASFLYVTEYQAGSFAGIQAPVCPPVARQSRLDFTDGLAHQSAAFTGDTRMVEVSCSADCHVIVGGTNPVATVNDTWFWANRVSYFVVTPGDKLSVIVNS